ncbi:hypothetical protein SAMN04487969_108148 [Paenibacillus algorifonticola]|uniref:Uncharacterized protein n=1 Tax=Paenibacillus algorifonticola TaxID=684063 RepID=A0A1I2E3N9_9BACL|nr:hypothetical protein SAMN04487969_108148 [Paenibacillus algorifonticola]
MWVNNGTKGVIWAGSKLKNIFGEDTVKTTKKLIYECNCFTAGTKVLTDEVILLILTQKNIYSIQLDHRLRIVHNMVKTLT